jgi:hypothetical protein
MTDVQGEVKINVRQGVREGFDARQVWQKAGRQVIAVRKVDTHVQSIATKVRLGPAFYQICCSNFKKASVTRPELYLEASFEIFLLMLALTWITTCIWNPDVLLRSKGGNRINDIFNYNNVCVGFDTAPARYVAQPLFALQSFLGIRFGNLDLLRLNLEYLSQRVTKLQFYFSAMMDLLFMGTMLLWPMLLIITPDQGGSGLNYHFYVYVIFVVIMYLTILAQFMEINEKYLGTYKIPLISKIWVRVYGVWTLLLLLIGFIAFNKYDYELCPSDLVDAWKANKAAWENAIDHATPGYVTRCQQEPAVPVFIMSVLDYGWFILLLFATPLLPYSPALNVPITLIVDDNARVQGVLANIDVEKHYKRAKEKTNAAIEKAKNSETGQQMAKTATGAFEKAKNSEAGQRAIELSEKAKAEVEKAKRSETGQRAAEGVRNAKATAAEAKAAASAKATELTAKAKEVTAKTFV